jgi:quinol monooxygenase YgiN
MPGFRRNSVEAVAPTPWRLERRSDDSSQIGAKAAGPIVMRLVRADVGNGYPRNNHTVGIPPMTTISPNAKIVTLINVFTVEPANQQQLLELLTRATETSVRHAPGFISSSLHRGLDGTKVAMYAQWCSVQDYQAMRDNPEPMPYLKQALAIAKFDPGMYEVVQTYSGTSS